MTTSQVPRVLFTVAFVATFVSGEANVTAQSRLEFRLAEHQPAANLVEAVVDQSNQKIYLLQEALVTDEDIIGAHAVPKGAGLQHRHFVQPCERRTDCERDPTSCRQARGDSRQRNGGLGADVE
jgi:hypothetical protein